MSSIVLCSMAEMSSENDAREHQLESRLDEGERGGGQPELELV